jgi:hypothetical protein
MTTLRQTIEHHAAEFAAAIVQALRGASIDELTSLTSGDRPAPRAAASPKTNGAGPAPRKGGRLGRRSADDIARTLEKIVAVVAQHSEGLRAEQIKAALGLDTREMPKPLAEGLKTGALKKEGNKRATTYSVGSTAGRKRRTNR